MKIQKILPTATFFICILNCLAYEAIKTNGYINRFCSDGCSKSFFEMALSEWSPGAVLIYFVVFLPFVVVLCNKNNPLARVGWFWFAFALLVISCVKIPGAMLGRWSSTADMFIILYFLAIPIPSIIWILIGIRSADANKSINERTSQ